MPPNDDPQRLVARVMHVDGDHRVAYLQVQNGTVVSHALHDDENLDDNDIILIGPQWDDIELAPSELWPDPLWVGIVRACLENEIVVNINGNLRTILRPPDIELAEGNTVEGSDTRGIIRVLSSKPVSHLEISLGEPFDVSNLREEPDGSLSYDDFGGYDDVKARTKELIELPLQHHDALLRIGARAIKGVLFTGPSGTGKTLLGRIIAHQAKAKR